MGVCTVRAPSMAGRWLGLCTLVMNVSLSAIWTHCMKHREQLAAKELSTELQQVTLILNYIKHTHSAVLFAKLCGDMGSGNDNILFHTEAWWLSRRGVLE